MPDARWLRDNPPLTFGEARIWARRLRRLGFSPVTIHYREADPIGGWPPLHEVRCNWPYDVTDLPDDIYMALGRSLYDGHGRDDGTLEYDGQEAAVTVGGAWLIYRKYAALRLGMGSKPLPRLQNESIGYEASVVPYGRFVYDVDDWPCEGCTHPDSPDDLSLLRQQTQSKA